MSNSFPYWGIDGCGSGWVCIGLNDAGEYQFVVAADIDNACREIKTHGARIALIDIPIGLSDGADERECDRLARKRIGKRRSSVFRVPCRQAIEAYREGGKEEQRKERGRAASIKVAGGPLSVQTWAIAAKIAEVDQFMQSGGNRDFALREVHPEVCFRALNGKTLEYNKKKRKGKDERREILERYLADTRLVESKIRCEYLKKEVADDDILDALIAAVTAKRIAPKHPPDLPETSLEKTLPDNPPEDNYGLPMEMVFAMP